MEKTPFIALIGAGLSMVPTLSYAQSLVCMIQRKEICQPNLPCRLIDNTMSSRIDLDSNSYSRCEKGSCQSYPVTIARSGQFVNLSGNYNGFMVKLDTENNELVELATLGLNTFISFGRCR